MEPGDTISLALEGPFAQGIGGGADNLVHRAARALTAAVGEDRGAAITLTKNLPIASGIGGGSADAAAAIQALVAFWQLDLSDDALADIGLSLGADVPVCLFGRPARIGGVGDQISAIGPLPDMGLVLVNPGIAVSTAKVFAAREGDYSNAASLPSDVLDRRALITALEGTRNDLAPPAVSIAPGIADVLDEIDTQPDCLLARLSGSGATCFGLFANSTSANLAARNIQKSHPDWWVHAGHFLTDRPVPQATS